MPNIWVHNCQSLFLINRFVIASSEAQLLMAFQSPFTSNLSKVKHQMIFFFFSLFNQVISLKTQLSYYKKVESWLREKLGNDEGRMRISRGVYLFSIGSNDYYAKILLTKGYTMLNSFSESNHVGMVIGNLTTVIKVSNFAFEYIFLKRLDLLTM